MSPGGWPPLENSHTKVLVVPTTVEQAKQGPAGFPSWAWQKSCAAQGTFCNVCTEFRHGIRSPANTCTGFGHGVRGSPHRP
eukprot:10835942-Lingulodinium_polyedra.AAC.1